MSKQLPVSVRNDYVRVLAGAIAADLVVEASELRKLYEVFALLDIQESVRLDILEVLANDPASIAQIEIPQAILEDAEARVALAKDTLALSPESESAINKRAVEGILQRIKLTVEQRAAIVDWVAWENTLLKQLGAGTAWMADSADPREITSRAASVGLPVGALYFAGITGFGATGITSGLATIGTTMGLTALGLNPMTAGIAGLIVMGISVKKVADYALSNGKESTAEIEARVKAIQTAHLKAATRIASDIHTLDKRLDAASDPLAYAILDPMREALADIEALASS